jgi:hypothetical protein
VFQIDTTRVLTPGRLFAVDRDLNIVALPRRHESAGPRVVVRTGLRREAGCVYTLSPDGIRRLRPAGA